MNVTNTLYLIAGIANAAAAIAYGTGGKLGIACIWGAAACVWFVALGIRLRAGI